MISEKQQDEASRRITFRVFAGGQTSSQVGPFTTAFAHAQMQMASQANIQIEIIYNKDLKTNEFSEERLITWLAGADVYVILNHIHQGNPHLNAETIKLAVRRLESHVGWPSGHHLECPVFLQDKYEYISKCPEISTPTLRVSLGVDMIPEILHFTTLHDEGNGWVVKLPFTTNAEGLTFCKNEGDIIDAIDRKSSQFQDRMSYAMVQPCLANRKEYKIVVLGGSAKYVADISQRKGLRVSFSEAPHHAIKCLAEQACEILESRCKGALTDPILRVDVMQSKNGLVINEFESLEASYYSNKFDQNELMVTEYIQSYWLAQIKQLATCVLTKAWEV
jgi:hypothetical protein